MGFDAGRVARGFERHDALDLSMSPFTTPALRKMISQQIEMRRHVVDDVAGLGNVAAQVAAANSLNRRLGDHVRKIASVPVIPPQTLDLIRAAGSPMIPADVLKKVRPPNLDIMTEPLRRAARMVSRPPPLVGLSQSVAQMLRDHPLAANRSVNWNLQRYVAQNNAAIRAALKFNTAFGPIVVPPEKDFVASDHQPDLQDVFPETDSLPEGFDVEEYWAVVVAFAQSIAQHHGAMVMVNGLRGGARVMFRVVNHPTSRSAAGSALSALAGHHIGGVEGVLFTATVAPYLIYLLTRDQK